MGTRIERSGGGSKRLGRDAWIAAGRRALIAGGVATVRVEPLAAALGVTTGSFYWHFRDRAAWLRALLADWREHNSAALQAAVERHRGDPAAAMRALVHVWLDEAGYSPAWDAAVRDWARTSRPVATQVRRVDEQRVRLLQRLFRRFGYGAAEAFIRARITYFHQVGYYALHIAESRARRRRLVPLYLKVLTGRNIAA
ncbi:MAG: TetR/AcrR family transcriptional regulator [Steroidobacteraceae bacterium]